MGLRKVTYGKKKRRDESEEADQDVDERSGNNSPVTAKKRVGNKGS